jgi:hypothetical protein
VKLILEEEDLNFLKEFGTLETCQMKTIDFKYRKEIFGKHMVNNS